MAVTLAALAVELRIISEPTATIPAGYSAILSRLLRLGENVIENRAPDAPQERKDAALIQLAGYLFDSPTSRTGMGFANAWVNSGAAALLAQWTTREVSVVTPSDDSEPSAAGAPGSGGAALDEAALDERIEALVSAWSLASNAEPIPAEKLVNAPAGLSRSQVSALIAQETAQFLDESGVNRRVAAGVSDWAETTNQDAIPANKLANAPGLDTGAVDARVRSLTYNWAEQGNADSIPADKLGLAAGINAATATALIEPFARAGNTDPIRGNKLTPTLYGSAHTRIADRTLEYATDETSANFSGHLAGDSSTFTLPPLVNAGAYIRGAYRYSGHNGSIENIVAARISLIYQDSVVDSQIINHGSGASGTYQLNPPTGREVSQRDYHLRLTFLTRGAVDVDGNLTLSATELYAIDGIADYYLSHRIARAVAEETDRALAAENGLAGGAPRPSEPSEPVSAPPLFDPIVGLPATICNRVAPNSASTWTASRGRSAFNPDAATFDQGYILSLTLARTSPSRRYIFPFALHSIADLGQVTAGSALTTSGAMVGGWGVRVFVAHIASDGTTPRFAYAIEFESPVQATGWDVSVFAYPSPRPAQ